MTNIEKQSKNIAWVNNYKEHNKSKVCTCTRCLAYREGQNACIEDIITMADNYILSLYTKEKPEEPE